MFKLIGRTLVPTIFIVAATSSSFGTTAYAQAATSCLPAGEQLPEAEISGFVADPGKTMAAHQDGGVGLSSAVQKLAASNSTTFGALMSALASANENQRSAAAAGIARAVDACRRAGTTGTPGAAEYADSMQSAIVATRDDVVVTAFRAALRDLGQAVASIGAAGGASAAGGGATSDGNSQDGAANSYRPSGNSPSQMSALRTYSINYVNSYGDVSTATSNSGTGQ